MSMMFNSQESQQELHQQERRYDPETLRKVTALATRLQHDHHETLTADQMASIGAEVGLKPEFVHQAIAQLETEQARKEQERRQQEETAQQTQQTEQQRTTHRQAVTGKTNLQTQTTGTKSEFYSVCAALASPLLIGFLAYYFKSGSHPQITGENVIYARTGMIALFTLIAPVPLALLQGFAAGRRRVGFAAAAALMFALAPTVPFLSAVTAEQYQQILVNLLDHLPEMFAYVMLGLPVVGAFGIMGAWMRQQYFPVAGGKSKDSMNALQHREYGAPTPYPAPQFAPMPTGPIMQAHPGYIPAQQTAPQNAYEQAYMAQNTTTAQAAGLQNNLQKQRRAYVSVDVAGLDNLRQSATLVAVDYSFGQLRAWIEEIVRINGGEVLTGNGSGLRASFPSDGQALRATRLMQERLPEFNRALNRLPMPFRLRCGVSAGEASNAVALERSQALLRAAEGGDTLIGSEVAAAALAELGPMSPLPGTLMGETAFVWRAGQPAPPAN